MVDFNLIHSLGNLDSEVNAAVATALGDAADDQLAHVVGGFFAERGYDGGIDLGIHVAERVDQVEIDHKTLR
jgi:hypothetical protein